MRRSPVRVRPPAPINNGYLLWYPLFISDIGLEPAKSTPISAKHNEKIIQTFAEIGRNNPADCFVVRRSNFLSPATSSNNNGYLLWYPLFVLYVKKIIDTQSTFLTRVCHQMVTNYLKGNHRMIWSYILMSKKTNPRYFRGICLIRDF